MYKEEETKPTMPFYCHFSKMLILSSSIFFLHKKRGHSQRFKFLSVLSSIKSTALQILPVIGQECQIQTLIFQFRVQLKTTTKKNKMQKVLVGKQNFGLGKKICKAARVMDKPAGLSNLCIIFNMWLCRSLVLPCWFICYNIDYAKVQKPLNSFQS